LKENTMTRQPLRLATAAFLFVSIAVLTSCKKESKEPASPTMASPTKSDSKVTNQPGVAGSVTEEVYIVQAVVSAVDTTTHKVTLKGPQGREYTFTAGPKIKNLAQLHVGDTVTATFARRMAVFVEGEGANPSFSRQNLDASADQGATPKMLVAEETKKIGRVKSIDPANHVAEIEFADNVVDKVDVRPDVDLSKYKVGDNVIVRVTTALTVIAETPRQP